MKRFLILALALVLVLSMFGCGFLRKKAEEVLEPALTDVFGEKEEPTAEPEPEPTAEPEPEPTAEPEPEPELDEGWKTAELEKETTETGVEMIKIHVKIPAGATLRIVFPYQDDYTYTNDSDVSLDHKVKTSIEAFLPEEPLTEGETLTVTPQLTITTADGTEHAIECPSFTYTAPEAFGPKNLIGMWTLTTAHVEGMTLKAADLGVEAYFDFLEDGKNVHCRSHSADGSDEYTMAYEVSGYTITLHDRVSDEYATYDPETDRIKLESDGVVMYLERMSDDEPVAPATEAPVAGEPETLVGTWVLTKGVAAGIEVSASQLGFDMSFVFNEDGSAAMIYQGETTDGLNWVQDGNVVKLSAYSIDLYDFQLKGSTLTLHETTNNVDLIFEKK